MRIAVSYQDGSVFSHFGHTETFKLYDVEGTSVTRELLLPAGGQGHEALAEFLSLARADVVICGGIGGPAYRALSEKGILICAGITGSADEAARAFASGTLKTSPCASCGHHSHEEGGACEHHGTSSCVKHEEMPIIGKGGQRL